MSAHIPVNCNRIQQFLSGLQPFRSALFEDGSKSPILHNVVSTMILVDKNDAVTLAPTTIENVGERVKNPDGVKYLQPHYIAHRSIVTEVTSTRFLSNTNRVQGPDGPIGTVAVFSSGATNGVGAPSIEQALWGLQVNRIHLWDIGYTNLVIDTVCLHNKVYSGDFGFFVDIEKMRQGEKLNCIVYEDSFPGLVYLCVIGNRVAVLLIFASGKFILMSVRYKGSEQKIFKMVQPIVSKYKTVVKPRRHGSNTEDVGVRKAVARIIENLTAEELCMEDHGALTELILKKLSDYVANSANKKRTNKPKKN